MSNPIGFYNVVSDGEERMLLVRGDEWREDGK